MLNLYIIVFILFIVYVGIMGKKFYDNHNKEGIELEKERLRSKTLDVKSKRVLRQYNNDAFEEHIDDVLDEKDKKKSSED